MIKLKQIFDKLPADDQHLVWSTLNQQPLKNFILTAIQQTQHGMLTMQAPDTFDHEALMAFVMAYRENRNQTIFLNEFLEIEIDYNQRVIQNLEES